MKRNRRKKYGYSDYAVWLAVLAGALGYLEWRFDLLSYRLAYWVGLGSRRYHFKDIRGGFGSDQEQTGILLDGIKPPFPGLSSGDMVRFYDTSGKVMSRPSAILKPSANDINGDPITIVKIPAGELQKKFKTQKGYIQKVK